MVALRSPLANMQMDAEAAAYIGVLERRVAALFLNEQKFLALMELSTGQKWETMIVDFEGNEIEKIAIAAVTNSLKVTDAEARRIVREYRTAMAGKENSVAEQQAVDHNENAPDNTVAASST